MQFRVAGLDHVSDLVQSNIILVVFYVLLLDDIILELQKLAKSKFRPVNKSGRMRSFIIVFMTGPESCVI